MVGGGGHGKDVGIGHIITTGAGLITTMPQVFILMLTPIGESTTGSIIGTDIIGIMNEFLTNDFNKTGRAGVTIDIGKGKEPGASRVITLDRNNRGRNSDSNGRRNIKEDQRFSDISNRWSNKNIPRLTNLKVNHTINPRFSNLMGNSNPDNSILNLRASNTRWNQSTSSTKEGLKEKIQNTRSRSIIANGDIRKLWPSSWFGMSRVSQLS